MGRKRKTSNSTVATVEGIVKYALEPKVVKIAAPDEIDDFTFILEDATVYNKHGQMVDLLSVIFDGPFNVRGSLTLDRNQDLEERFVKPNVQVSYIEIRGCVRYSVGDTNDTPCLWAGGRGGWYELRPPSSKYASIYKKMSEGVALYYAMLDIHETHESKKRRKQKKGSRKPTRDEIFQDLAPDTMFFKYAVAIGDGSVKQDVIDRCNEHAPFLICHFYQDTSFDWEPTTLFKWLTGQHKELHERALESLHKKQGLAAAPGPVVPTPDIEVEDSSEEEPSVVDPPAQKALSKTKAKKPSRTSSDFEDVESRDFAVNTGGAEATSIEKNAQILKTRSPSRPPSQFQQQMDIDSGPEAQTQLPAEEETITALQTLVDVIGEIKAEHTKAMSKITIATVSSRLFFKCKMRNYEVPKEILIYYSRALVPALDEEVWGASPFYALLKDQAREPIKVPTQIPLNAIPTQCQRRKVMVRTQAAKDSQSGANVTPKTSGKLLTTTDHELLDESQGESSAAPRPKRGRPSGKMSGLRLAGTSKKRYMSLEDTESGTKASKMSKKSPFFEDDEDDEVMGDSSSTNEEDDEQFGEALAPVKIVVRAERLPSMIPKGPNGTWVCEEEDCGYVVRGADGEDGRDRVRQHLQDAHSQPAEGQIERINLAVTESRGHIPIDHLLEKLRKMGEKVQKSEQLELDGETLPQPIKRRLII